MTRLLPGLLALLWGASALADTITCLGRIEPLDGVRTLAGPSGFSGAGSVIAELKVAEGDWVEAEQVLAILDGYPLYSAEVKRQEELLKEARLQLKRLQDLSTTQSTSQAKLDEARFKVSALAAERGVSEARLEMSLLRAPARGQVLKIYTHPGEKVGSDGVLELGETDKMTVVAEVYETDIRHVSEGMTAKISSPALDTAITGKIIKIGLRVGKMDVLSSDPVADTDARVVETTILVDDPEPLRRLTNLQVDVEIGQ